MKLIMGTKRQVCRMMCLSTLITLMGGMILIAGIFLPLPTYAGVAAVWTLNSNGVAVGSKAYSAPNWMAHSYHRNSDGTATLLWTQPGKASVWFLNSDGVATSTKAYSAAGWEARSYHRYSDGTATLLWTKLGVGSVWFLNSNGVPTGTKAYNASGWTATSYVRYSDGTASLLWTKESVASVWFLNSNGVPTGTKAYNASGWTAQSYHRNSDGTASLLWTKLSVASVWTLNSNGVPAGSKAYNASGWTATGYMGSGALAAIKTVSVTNEVENAKVITLQKTGSGTGTITAGTQVCDAACTELEITYIEGKQVDVTVTPAAGSYFVGWETVGGVQIENIYYAEPGDTVFAIFELQ